MAPFYTSHSASSHLYRQNGTSIHYKIVVGDIFWGFGAARDFRAARSTGSDMDFRAASDFSSARDLKTTKDFRAAVIGALG